MMWFRLATVWGCTVREAQERCDSREFAEWIAYDTIAPLGSERTNILVAILSSVMANAFRGKSGKAIEAKDILDMVPGVRFKIQDGRKHRRTNTQHVITKMQAWATAHNRKMEKQHGKRRLNNNPNTGD